VELLAERQTAPPSLGPISLFWLVGYYGLLMIMTLSGAKLTALVRQKLDLTGSRPIWILNLGLALLTIMVWQQALSLPDGKLHLTVLDVGEGEAIFVQTPTGRNLLINGGPSPNTLADALGRRLPFRQREIDFIVVAGSGDQQISALPGGIDRFYSRNVLWSGPKAGSNSARALQEKLAKSDIPVYEAENGQILDLGEGAQLEIAAVTPRGAVLLLRWGDFLALLPIGLDFESMEALLKDRNLVTVTALLLADSGYAPLNPPEWITHWRSQVVLLSVEAGNEEGLPSAETLAALKGHSLLRTDQNGWIELTTDGKQMWVEVERK
jgi:competence protein ComEC